MTRTSRKKLLLVSFHFPPLQGSSGLHRSLALATYLPRHDWDVTVLSVSKNCYGRLFASNEQMLPLEGQVLRPWAFDVSKLLSFRGRSIRVGTAPDGLAPWVLTGVARGWMDAQKRRPDAILSTYPIASAHAIGFHLSGLLKSPWIMDFRDPMAQPDYPEDHRIRARLHASERQYVTRANRVLVTTPGARSDYQARYPELENHQITLVPNGYEERLFEGVSEPTDREPGTPRRLIHSGALYRNERDPTALFHALAKLRSDIANLDDHLRVTFRGAGNVAYFNQLAVDLGVQDLVEFAPSIPYNEAIQEMCAADGLLLLQASNCNSQIPAKVYEYFRARRPILALTDPAGDTGSLLRESGLPHQACLDDAGAIASLLRRYLDDPDPVTRFSITEPVEQFARARAAEHVASILDEVIKSAS